MENPKSRKSATAMPAGAHTGDALTFTEAKPSPIFPAKRYAQAMSTQAVTFTAG
jgi:hypothetical protein